VDVSDVDRIYFDVYICRSTDIYPDVSGLGRSYLAVYIDRSTDRICRQRDLSQGQGGRVRLR